MTSMTFYNTNTSSSTLATTAKTLLENPTTASNATNLNTNLTSGTTGWVEMWSFGDASAQSGAGSEPSPTGHGWIDDSTTFEGNHFASGTWTWKVEMETTTSGTFTCDIHCRAYQRSSGGTYTLIVEGVATSQTIVTASYTTFTVTASGASASNTFATGDKFYTDLILNITTNGTTGNVRVHMAGSSTVGYVNGAATVAITTPGYLASTQIDKDVAFRGRIMQLVDKDVAFRGRIQALVDKDIKFRGNVGFQALKDIRFRGIVAAQVQKYIAFRGRVSQQVTKDIVFRAKPANTVDKNIAFRGKISGPRILSGGFTVFANGTGTATFDKIRWTQVPDPSLNLSAVIPRLGATSVVTNAIVANNTFAATATSTDGVNWTSTNAVTPILEARTQSAAVSSTTVSWTHVIGNNSNRILIVGVEIQGTTAVSTVTFNSVSMTRIGFASTTSARVELWYLLAPSIGSFSVTVTTASSVAFAAGSISYYNTLQSAPTAVNTATGNSGTATVAISGATTNQLVLGMTATDGSATLTATSAQIVRWYNTIYSNGYQTDYPVATPGTQNVNWSLSSVANWSTIGCLITANASTTSNLPNLTSQPIPTIDVFAVSTLTNYTQTNQTGGSPATWAYDTANSRILGTSGVNALYLYTTVSSADIDIFADFDTSDAGGIAFDFVDANNFYYLQINDTKSSTGTTNTGKLVKVSSGSASTLGTFSLTYTVGNNPGSHYQVYFTRSTFRRFRCTMLAGIITVYMDGVQLFQYTDNSSLGSGLCGLYQNGGTTGLRCYQLWIVPQGQYVSGTPIYDFVTSTYVYTKESLSTLDPTVTPQIENVETSAFSPEIANGAVIPNVTYNNTFTNKAFDDLASASGSYTWYINENKHFIFGDLGMLPAPWILQSAPYGIVQTVDLEMGSDQVNSSNSSKNGNLELDQGNQLYRNRQTILGALTVTALQTEFNVGDGNTRTFPVGYGINQLVAVILNGVAQTIGLKGQSGFQFYWGYDDPHVIQDAGQPVLQATDLLEVQYTGLIPATVTIDDTTEQARVAAIEGGSGIVEDVEDHSQDSPQLTTDQAIDLAQSLLNRYAIQGRQLIFDTTRNGLTLGQTLTIFFPEHDIWNGQFIVTEIETKLMKDVNDSQIWWYKVTCSEFPRQASWYKLLASGLGLFTS